MDMKYFLIFIEKLIIFTFKVFLLGVIMMIPFYLCGWMERHPRMALIFGIIVIIIYIRETMEAIKNG